MSITVYGFGRSRAQRAVWALEEAGLDYEWHAVDARAGELSSEAFLALNPGGKVPVLVDDGFVLTESAVICTYIGEKVPERELVPSAGTRARYRYEQWMAFTLTELEQPLWTMGKHRFALPRDLRVPQMLDVAPKEFARAEAVLARGFGEGPHLLGERFTMIDVMVGHTLFWAMAFGVEVQSDPLRAYAARLAGRPAWKRALERTGG